MDQNSVQVLDVYRQITTKLKKRFDRITDFNEIFFNLSYPQELLQESQF